MGTASPCHRDSAHRRDIDGLRALAIVPVVLFHTHVPGFGGGYVGVDIFFVISGYLITGILAREIDSGGFSVTRFYERRARRILPALLVVLAFVLVAASWLYLPSEFADVPRSALMVLLFLSNVWFFLKSGYFAGPSETMPLLHCWSLAVEEQFYLAFPWLLWLCARGAPRWRVPVVLVLAAGSLAWALAKQADTDGFAFYLLPPRAWELFAGALLALEAVPPLRHRLLREGAALAGLALIAFAVFTYDRHTVFPGITAIPPVLGSALLLHCGPGTLVGRALSRPLPVGIGLISYSLYLWHWPLIVFAEYAGDAKLAGTQRLLVIGATLAIATASWRFVEQPFRDTRRFDRQRILILSGAGMVVLAGAATAMLPLGGWPGRFPPEVNTLIAAQQDFSPRRKACLNNAIGGERPECTLGATVPPSAVLWGDSHGVELAWVLSQQMGQQHQSLMERTRGSCPPVIAYANAADPGCARFNAEVMARITSTPRIRRVYLVAFWASPTYRLPQMAGWIDATIAGLRAAGKQVTVIGPVPPQPFNVPRRLAHAAASGQLDAVSGASLATYRSETDWFTSRYPGWRAQGVAILDPLHGLARGDVTRLMQDGRPLYFDEHHLSLAGARAVLAPSRSD